MSRFSKLSIRSSSGAPRLLQGWYPSGDDSLAAGFAKAGELGVVRVQAFPDTSQLKARLQALRTSTDGQVGLDLKGVMGNVESILAALKERLASFALHTHKAPEGLVEGLRELKLTRFGLAGTPEEAAEAKAQGVAALVAQPGADFRALQGVGLPVFAAPPAGAHIRESMEGSGLAGLQVRSGAQLKGTSLSSRLRHAMGERAFGLMLDTAHCEMPTLKIRNLEITYPIIQGGMGVGISWDRLAGSVAQSGCVGIVSAIGAGYRDLGGLALRHGRPAGSESLNGHPQLTQIIQNALRTANGHGAVGVNVLCAINGYEKVVRTAVEAGAQMVISGAGLPMALPDIVGDRDVALVPIVSSARALGLICKSWGRKHGRLPDAVVLEGPESGGHQGFTEDQCADPAFALENLLPAVLAERDRWGSFPVIVAGGVWDRGDIQKFLAMGASAVQMGTRFIGTFECDADQVFKETLLKADREDIRLMKSPVGMPARGVMTQLQRDIAGGEAPTLRCISNCLSPCHQGAGAQKAGFCIADRLADAMRGRRETGLFFSGSNGWRLKDMISVRELIEELTGDYGLERLALA